MSIGAITVDEVVGRDTDQQALQETIAAIRSLPEEATGHVHRLLCSLFGDTAVNHIMMSSRGNRQKKVGSTAGAGGNGNTAKISNREKKRRNKELKGSGKPILNMDKRKK